jgi:hypothetical protein
MKKINSHILGLLLLLMIGLGNQSTFGQTPDPSQRGGFVTTAEEYDLGNQAFTPTGFPAPIEIRAVAWFPLIWQRTFSDRNLPSRPPLNLLHWRQLLSGMALRCRSPAYTQLPRLRLFGGPARKPRLHRSFDKRQRHQCARQQRE